MRYVIIIYFLGDKVLCNGSDHVMADSDNEVADTRIVLNVNHALQRGTNKILIRTVDTDVIVILIGQFKNIMAFGTGSCFFIIASILFAETWDRSNHVASHH